MHRASTAARFATALAVAFAVHAAVLVSVDLPPLPAPAQAPSVTIKLLGYEPPPVAVTPIEQPPPTVAEPAPPAAAPAEAVVAEPPRPTAPPSRPLAGRTVAGLARDVAAFAERDRPDPRVSSERVPRLAAGADLAPEFAYYLEAWQRKVERFGNLNYPAQARANALTGSLRLLATIAADGDLEDVRVLETSGHAVLDEAAVRIVRLAAPYAPFSPKMHAAAERIEIERRWHFRNSRYSF